MCRLGEKAASLLLVACTVCFGDAHATTLHHWRFEAGAFALDSAGASNLTNTVVQQLTLPASGRGSTFSQLPNLANASAAYFNNNGGFSAPIMHIFGNWTVEFLIHFDDLGGGATFGTTLYYDGICNGSDGKGTVYIGLRNSTDLGTQPFELYASGRPFNVAKWGFFPEVGKDYYVAFVYDHVARTLTLHRKNLTDGTPLATATSSFSTTPASAGPTTLTLGHQPSCPTDFRHNGLMDEVRVSDKALALNELLISNASEQQRATVPFPLPALIVLAMVLVAGALRIARGRI